jgi:hypothetical protein
VSNNIQVTFPNLDDVTRRLRAVGAASQLVFRDAAEAGGRVVQKAAIANAPGPGIGIEVAAESSTRAVASVGPLKNKWFYKFHEKGTKAHKATGKGSESKSFQKYLKRIGRSDLASTIQPMMRLGPPGVAIFARKVKGHSGKLFMEPALKQVGEISAAVGEVYLDAILEKAA